MGETYDAIVIGLGGMGSAAAYRLARRGLKVLGLEQFDPAHDKGSSHGRSRIIRQAYFEDPSYVPLLLRAYELWEELEADQSETILTYTGGLMMGAEHTDTVTGSIRSAGQWDLDHDVLDAAGIRRRFPNLAPPEDVVALYEPRAGFLRPEASVRAHLRGASARGADLRFGETVVDWTASSSGDGVSVTTSGGTYEASRLIVSAGPWAGRLLSELDLPLQVERLVQYWFMPRSGVEAFSVDRQPIYIWELEDEVQFYGFPNHDDPATGSKVAFFRESTICTPETIDRTVHAGEVEHMRECIRERVPDLNGELIEAKTCMYTTTPDMHFVVSQHPEYEQVAIAAGFSGHGFKFVSVMGEILADLASEGETGHPISLFDIGRLAG